MTIKIANVRCWNNDVVVIDCGGEDERTETKAAIESFRSNDYVVRTSTKLNQRFKTRASSMITTS